MQLSSLDEEVAANQIIIWMYLKDGFSIYFQISEEY